MVSPFQRNHVHNYFLCDNLISIHYLIHHQTRLSTPHHNVLKGIVYGGLYTVSAATELETCFELNYCPKVLRFII